MAGQKGMTAVDIAGHAVERQRGTVAQNRIGSQLRRSQYRRRGKIARNTRRDDRIQPIAYFPYSIAPGELGKLISAAMTGKSAAMLPLIGIENLMSCQKVLLQLIQRFSHLSLVLHIIYHKIAKCQVILWGFWKKKVPAVPSEPFPWCWF